MGLDKETIKGRVTLSEALCYVVCYDAGSYMMLLLYPVGANIQRLVVGHRRLV